MYNVVYPQVYLSVSLSSPGTAVHIVLHIAAASSGVEQAGRYGINLSPSQGLETIGLVTEYLLSFGTRALSLYLAPWHWSSVGNLSLVYYHRSCTLRYNQTMDS